jgi:hypothetical protein
MRRGWTTMDKVNVQLQAHWKMVAGRHVVERLELCLDAVPIGLLMGAARWDAIMAGTDEEDTGTHSLGALLEHYRRGHPLHTLAAMAAHLAEHSAILLIEATLTPHDDPLVAEMLVRVEPTAYPLTDELRRFGHAVEAATGIEYIAVIPARWPDGPDFGHSVFFGPLPA